jgi:SAM-dependent methyltransferase
VGVDTSSVYLDLARQRVHDVHVEFRVEDAADLTFEPALFDVSVAGLVLNFVPAPQQAVSSMARVVKNEGIVAAYVWDYEGRMDMMRHFWDAAAAIDPAAREMEVGQHYALCQPDRLRSLFQSAGLTAVDVTFIDVQTRFKDFDDYWLPFLNAQGSAARYMRSLNAETRAALRDQLQKQLPTTGTGEIPLMARVGCKGN